MDPELSVTLTFEFERETKRTIRYNEVPTPGQPPAVGTLYLQKHLQPDPANPVQRITVTIAAA